MNQELFDSMQKQMIPSPEVREALSEKLAQPAKKRPVPWMKYGAVAACAALVIGAFSLHSYGQESGQWMFFVRSFNRDVVETKLHSYVTVEDLTGYTTEDAAVNDKGSGGEIYSTGVIDRDAYAGDILDRPQTPNTGALPGGAYIGDVPVQEGAEDYQKLMDHFNGTYPDWYGGAYLDSSGWLVIQLVEDKDPADKSLELQVLDWTGSDHVMFSSCKYSLAQLTELMDQLNALPDTDMKYSDVMAGWGIDEEHNRIELTLTQVYEPLLSVLAELDPDDDAIYVQVGQRASVRDAIGEVVSTDSASTEDPAVRHVMPGGATVPDDEDLIADEPVYDGAHYDVDNLPEELPEQKQPAFVETDFVRDEDVNTSSYNPDAK